jgi:ankyrin repeat protein
MRLLLERGAELDAQSNIHSTALAALHLAIELKKVALAQLLLDHGVSIQARGKDFWTPLHSASWNG